MIKLTGSILALLLMTGASPARAGLIDLYDWGIHVNGASIFSFDDPLDATDDALGAASNTNEDPYFTPLTSDFDPLPGSVGIGSFGFSNGMGSGAALGTISVRVRGAGAHKVLGFFDVEIDEPTNTWFNENASSVGIPAAGQSWEVDIPVPAFGNIFSHVVLGNLDNMNLVPAGMEEDVSMAMGYAFSLADSEVATVSFVLSPQAPSDGFYLRQRDPDSDQDVYFYSRLDIRVSAPATALLVAVGVVGMVLRRRRT